MKVKTIEIQFPCEVDTPEGWERALDGLLDIVCKKYQKENPSDVMWPSGHGSKPTFSQADAAFLGKPTKSDAPMSGEPTWDDSVYQISMAVREDYYGDNPHNPNRDALKAEQRARDDVRRASKGKT
jgi:hypothetical protein